MISPEPTTAFTIRADGWVRDSSGAWHEPGHAFPMRIKLQVTLPWPADWRGLMRAVWQWLHGRPASIEATINEQVWVSTRLKDQQ